MSPFDSAKYEALLEGLEISEISFSRMLESTVTFRCDPEYFQKSHLRDEATVFHKREDFTKLGDLGLGVDASAFYPSIEGYYGTGTLPFLRVADVNMIIDLEECTTIPAMLCTSYPTLKKVHPGDIVLTKGGSVARIGLVTRESAVSRDLIFINSSKLQEADYVYLYLYCLTDFFNRMLLRSSSQTAQPHLTLTLMRPLPVKMASASFKARCLALVKSTFKHLENANEAYKESAEILITALGLRDWQPPEPLTYTCSVSEAFEDDRLDAEHFQPKYKALLDHVRDHAVRCRVVDEIAEKCDRGEQPKYSEDGTLAVVTSQHILENGLDYEGFERTDETYWEHKDFISAQIQKGDILTYMTGANVGRTAAYLAGDRALASNEVNILCLREENPIYVSVAMNSMIGRWQTRMSVTGSAQVHLYPQDIRRFVIPFVDEGSERAIVDAVMKAYSSRRKAHRLLESAKHSVEIAIEESEERALAFLGEVDPGD